MAYRFLSQDRSLDAGLRRIATDQIDKALRSLEARGEDRAEAIHDLRKRCKKMRGLVRLVRPAFDDYKAENEAFRDVARLFSDLRDAKVLQDTYDLIVGRYDAELDRSATGEIRRALTAERKRLVEETDLDRRFAEARRRLKAGRARAAEWKTDEEGWEALSGGLAKTYGRAREAMAEAADDPTGEKHHEWRKRVKYHWYHCRLLECSWPDPMAERAAQAHRLSNHLGDHHDLFVFEAQLHEEPDRYGSMRAVEALVALARRYRATLEEKAHRLGARLLADEPDALVERFGKWWTQWDREGALGSAALGR